MLVCVHVLQEDQTSFFQSHSHFLIWMVPPCKKYLNTIWLVPFYNVTVNHVYHLNVAPRVRSYGHQAQRQQRQRDERTLGATFRRKTWLTVTLADSDLGIGSPKMFPVGGAKIPCLNATLNSQSRIGQAFGQPKSRSKNTVHARHRHPSLYLSLTPIPVGVSACLFACRFGLYSVCTMSIINY